MLLNFKMAHNRIVKMRYLKEIVVGLTLLLVYIVFWFWFFTPPNVQNVSGNISKNILNKQFSNSSSTKINSSLVLGTQIIERTLPLSYEITIDIRKQFYGLSCEFAAATGIIFHFTNDSNFAVSNQSNAEKILIDKVIISKNPNIGIRMGDGATGENLYANLNMWFGGSEYYGIHAPPFFDLFKDYKLISKPIYINDSTVSMMQKAISEDHLIMAWIKIGYAQSIDDALSYGKVKIVKGEHAIVINGYDGTGVIVMDPGIGARRHINYSSLFAAANPFPIPFLEVYKSPDSKISDLIIGFDIPMEINRSVPKVYVENGAGNVGVANQMRDILKDFGYRVIGINNADNFDYQDVTIKTKKDFSDFLYLLKKDIEIASFTVASSSADLAENSNKDIIVIIGK
jgi:uncharacterized protein YvpB